MRRQLVLVGLILTFLSLATVPSWGQAKPEDVGVSSERLRRIDELLKRHIDEHRIAGAVTLVARKGAVVHFTAHGLADAEAKKPMSRDNLFRMASSTKRVMPSLRRSAMRNS